ncbi:methyltransferase domain-containing protein [Marixanthomonas sp. SCSIO 43207]|uniref:methyltransferase domain-containing protein n=1 Tax=Marixanthomonas sp. SCSIO 43207 TaxID=2779360 RepID=UPI001CA89941|nr:methyltransferase domain-containing protein [Marixanthomonas sp. SCSIO 43207]UAB80572.1 methyltransferase domain-containing protein [Marixanthomonas sp. SCSIO 43207]
MPSFSSKYRSTEIEVMDSFHLQGKDMQAVLTDLKTVSTLLRGASITLNGIKKLLTGYDNQKCITILDIGCGDGEMLRQCARFGKKYSFNFNLIGLDANKHIISEAKKRCKPYENITFTQFDVFSSQSLPHAEIIVCNLFLHHFKNEEITLILQKLVDSANMGVVVNDLNRNKLAFSLFKIFSRIFLKTDIAKNDGLVSVARGFKRREIELFSEKIYNQKSHIRWKWAFRYQWILKKQYEHND